MPITTFIRSLDPRVLQSCPVPEPYSAEISCRIPPWIEFPKDGFGESFHESFQAFSAGERVELAHYIYLRPLDRWLKSVGVERMHAEWRCYARHGLPGGNLDALLFGGYRQHGILEIKTEHTGFDGWYLQDAIQAALYAAVLRAWGRSDPLPWICLAYVAPGKDSISVYYWPDSRRLLRAVESLLNGRN